MVAHIYDTFSNMYDAFVTVQGPWLWVWEVPLLKGLYVCVCVCMCVYVCVMCMCTTIRIFESGIV